jgi:hypothetical protein
MLNTVHVCGSTRDRAQNGVSFSLLEGGKAKQVVRKRTPCATSCLQVCSNVAGVLAQAVVGLVMEASISRSDGIGGMDES